MPSSSVNPPVTEDNAALNSAERSSLPQEGLLDNSVAFDPDSVAPSDEFVFDTHEVITKYLEKHFRSSLHKDV